MSESISHNMPCWSDDSALCPRGSLVAPTGFPDVVSVQTKTLRYNKCSWVTVERLEQHWVKATVDGRIIDPPGVSTRN